MGIAFLKGGAAASHCLSDRRPEGGTHRPSHVSGGAIFFLLGQIEGTVLRHSWVRKDVGFDLCLLCWEPKGLATACLPPCLGRFRTPLGGGTM
jgi:hypothetical protein